MAGQTKPRCYDCAFFKDDAAFAQCWHDKLVVWDPVFGDQPSKAREQRREHGICGPDATLFEERQPTSFEEALSIIGNAIVDHFSKARA